MLSVVKVRQYSSRKKGYIANPKANGYHHTSHFFRYGIDHGINHRSKVVKTINSSCKIFSNVGLNHT